MKPVQFFSEEYLEHCKSMKPAQIVEFLEGFRNLSAAAAPVKKSVLISMKVEPDLLEAFKAKAAAMGVPYQTQIKKLMKSWVLD
jgi:predicted DNA binding CopG/RHH family protein